MGWTIHEGELDHEDVRALLAQHFAEMRAGSPPSACHVLPADGMKSADLRFFTLRENGDLLGCGALRRIEPGHAEIKSMRTARAHLRRGVARTMLEHLLAEARAAGYRRVSLETGSMAYFEPARRLYASFGFVECAPFGRYTADPNSIFMTLELQGAHAHAADR